MAQRALQTIDLTDLSDDPRPDAMTALAHRAVTPWGNAAALCVWPQFVREARRALGDETIKVATVINFPQGDEDVARAVADTVAALRDGADEIDLVLPYRALLAGRDGPAQSMIAAVAERLAPHQRLKAILETGVLREPAMIERASRLAIAGGAHFLKTSTGKTAVSATPEAATIMLGAIRAEGGRVGFKASGGLRALTDAAVYLDLADRIMGSDWARPGCFRLGASGLIEALTAVLRDAKLQR